MLEDTGRGHSRGDLRTYFDHRDDGTTKERIEQPWEREATEITNKARSGDAMTTWPGLPMTMSTFRDLTEKRWQCSLNFHSQNAIQKGSSTLYNCRYNIRICPAWSRWTPTKYHPSPLKIQIVEFCLFVKMSSISISLDHLSQNGAKFNSLSIENCVILKVF